MLRRDEEMCRRLVIGRGASDGIVGPGVLVLLLLMMEEEEGGFKADPRHGVHHEARRRRLPDVHHERRPVLRRLVADRYRCCRMTGDILKNRNCFILR